MRRERSPGCRRITSVLKLSSPIAVGTNRSPFRVKTHPGARVVSSSGDPNASRTSVTEDIRAIDRIRHVDEVRRCAALLCPSTRGLQLERGRADRPRGARRRELALKRHRGCDDRGKSNAGESKASPPNAVSRSADHIGSEQRPSAFSQIQIARTFQSRADKEVREDRCDASSPRALVVWHGETGRPSGAMREMRSSSARFWP